jgi:hypothetical protein
MAAAADSNTAVEATMVKIGATTKHFRKKVW